MTQEELTQYNLGESLDQLMNIDPRGYGVCRILYEGAREYTKEPLTMHSARLLHDTLKEGDLVYLLTGFVLLPFKKAEMDGIVSTFLLARALVKAYGVKPVVICAKDNMKAAEALAFDMGLHFYTSIEELKRYPASVAAVPFTDKTEEAKAQTDELLSCGIPKAVVSIECPGANEKGIYHNATGLNVTDLEAKQDILFVTLKNQGVLNIAIGDLGNELGMGALQSQIKKYIPYAGKGGCQCGCNGGILAQVAADNVITATVSDWGCYGLIAATAYLNRNMDIMHTKDLEEKAMNTACHHGMIDMYGWLIPAIDGLGVSMNRSIVNLMRECVQSTLDLESTCQTWFQKVIERKYFEEVVS